MANRNYNLTEVKTEASEFLKTKKKVNETTYLNYRTSINYFIYYLTDVAKIEVLGTDNKEKVLEDFQGSLLEGFTFKAEAVERFVKVKPSTVNSHVRRIKTFLNRRLGLTVEITKLKVNKPKYKALPKELVELLANECSNKWKNEEIAVRNATLIRFLFNTAFRVEEALGITTDNLYKINSSYFVKIHEKGTAKGELKEVAIGEKSYNMLMDYINIKSVPSDYVFSSIKASKDGKAKAFNRQNFNKAMNELAFYVDSKYKGTKINNEEVNTSKVIENNSSHVFRHSKAIYLLNVKKEDIITVKEVLRHNSLDSTLIYLNPQEEAINKVRTANEI